MPISSTYRINKPIGCSTYTAKNLRLLRIYLLIEAALSYYSTNAYKKHIRNTKRIRLTIDTLT